MSVHLTKDIHPITDLKRHTRELLNHAHSTGRPLILTVNGKADAVLLDVTVFEKLVQAGNMARLLTIAEQDIKTGKTQSFDVFLKEFKAAREIPD